VLQGQLAGEFDVGGVGVGSGEDFAAFAELLEVGDEDAMQVAFSFVASEGVGDTAGHVGRISEIAGTGFLNDDEIFLHGAMRDLRLLWSEDNPKNYETSLTTYGEGEIESGRLSNKPRNCDLVIRFCSERTSLTLIPRRCDVNDEKNLLFEFYERETAACGLRTPQETFCGEAC